ncbi:hypothetical protein CFP66_12555 [Pseudonocardia sp. MH-G8]|nr:hypothetical protein [Pseudonocardia sp. MH-G8]OZM81776.1 hypothetical protein CFP66_12555 [Pseudonocardia sp. MH-G8]
MHPAVERRDHGPAAVDGDEIQRDPHPIPVVAPALLAGAAVQRNDAVPSGDDDPGPGGNSVDDPPPGPAPPHPGRIGRRRGGLRRRAGGRVDPAGLARGGDHGARCDGHGQHAAEERLDVGPRPWTGRRAGRPQARPGNLHSHRADQHDPVRQRQQERPVARERGLAGLHRVVPGTAHTAASPSDSPGRYCSTASGR